MPAILGALQRGNGLPGAEVRESIVSETVTKAIPEIVPETVPGIDAETVTEIGTENSSSVLIDNLSAPAPPLKSHAITSDALPDLPPTYVASNRAPNPLQPRPPPPKSHDTLNAVGPRRTGGWGIGGRRLQQQRQNFHPRGLTDGRLQHKRKHDRTRTLTRHTH